MVTNAFDHGVDDLCIAKFVGELQICAAGRGHPAFRASKDVVDPSEVNALSSYILV